MMSDLTPEQLEIADLTERLKDALHDKVMADAKHLGEIEQLQAKVKELTTQNIANGKLVLDAEEESAELEAQVKGLKEVAQRRLEYIDKKNERIEELETLISIKDKLLDSHIQQIRTLEAALAKEQNKP